MGRDAQVPFDRLALDYGGNLFTKAPDGSYALELKNAAGMVGARLRFSLEKPVVRHGDDGVVHGLMGENMFYYFSPRCRVEGAVLLDGAWEDVADGLGWYDHEFGDSRALGEGHEATVGWNWLAAQLDNGWEVSAYDLFDRVDPSKTHGRWAILIDPAGERHAYTDFTFEALDRWTSTKTFNEYPAGYRLEVKHAGLSLEITPAMPGQEVITIISAPAFWEGRVQVRGVMHGAVVSGPGFVERSGVSVVDTTDDLFSSVGRETRRAIDRLLPAHPTHDQAMPLIAGPGRAHFLDGVDLEQYSRTVIGPIRDIILRGGKAWRSYGFLSCMDIVGGDSQPFAHWLAMPELLHVGSLIIDDVQDDSDVRRGGPACHKLYGDALAINAGCASYFLAQIPAITSGLSAALLVRIYEAYFEAVRAAHAGQALDIDGMWHLMPGVVDDGDGALIERRVLAVHRLKSAAPCGALARMAALIGGGTDQQAEGLGSLFEAFGVAFQIIDDVLNLRGFDENRKNQGEDISAGKITAPVAKAMGLLARERREQLWSIIQSKPTDRARIGEAVSLVERCGALDACEREARAMVEDAWTRVDSLIPDTQYKIRLRAFGWFVLDRHY
jgi:geranylgeranyl pyrophosphate synthase